MRLSNCIRCSTEFVKELPSTKLCASCKAPRNKELATNRNQRRDVKLRESALAINKESTRGLSWLTDDPDLLWVVRFAVPFDVNLSKNAATRFGKHGAYTRTEARVAKQGITLLAKSTLRGRTVVEGKVWIDILVQKPHNRGDAINYVDSVCDAVRDAIDFDDNYFCIRRLDWEIVKKDPKIIIGIGQEYESPHRPCSYCGTVKPHDLFGKDKGNKFGITRVCKDCSVLQRKDKIEKSSYI